MDILQAKKKGMFNFILMMVNILTGKLSFVGAPIVADPNKSSEFDYKPGITGMIQINSERIQNQQSVFGY